MNEELKDALRKLGDLIYEDINPPMTIEWTSPNSFTVDFPNGVPKTKGTSPFSIENNGHPQSKESKQHSRYLRQEPA